MSLDTNTSARYVEFKNYIKNESGRSWQENKAQEDV